ncbi:MAG: endonuclease [Candidatus Marinimicrobia bacterium]|nr:endonuclease [Candidatus Neomarinimicrobiota bacterium]
MIIFVLLTSLWSQENIAEGLSGDALVDYLRTNYKTSSTLGYNAARDELYANVDRVSGQVKGIYTNYAVTLPDGVDPSTYLYENGMNCEHVWPQSLYSGSEPMKSDMHHLRPCKDNVNSSRGNKPFGEILDSQTDHWYWQSQNSSNIPSSNINEYSESSSTYFEPREDRKGDIARTIFYFFTMYPNEADDSFFHSQKEQMRMWHEQDPSNNAEVIRTWSIAGYQQNKPNPFILDESLIVRAYFPEDMMMAGDVNGDSILNILDVVTMVGFIMGTTELNPPYDEAADMNEDGIVNVLDVVTLVNFILS